MFLLISRTVGTKKTQQIFKNLFLSKTTSDRIVIHKTFSKHDQVLNSDAYIDLISLYYATNQSNYTLGTAMSDLNSGLFNKDSIHYPSRVYAHLNEIELHTL